MTDHNLTEEQQLQIIQKVIQDCEKFHIKLHTDLVRRGIEPIDAVIGAVHAAIKTAAAQTGGMFEAIHWMRTAVDHAERILIEEVRTGGCDIKGNTIQ